MELFDKERKENLEFFTVVVKNIRIILLFVCFSTLLTLVITLFIPKQYTSFALVFPTESNSIEEVVRNPQFGYDVEADRLIQILKSWEIMDSIAKKFDLIRYYRIDKTDPDWYDVLQKKYEEDITINRTIYMSVRISATTKSPEMSAAIVNTMVSLVNKTREKLLKQNTYIAIRSLEDEYFSLKKDLDSLSTVIGELSKNRPGFKQFVQTDRYIYMVRDNDQLDQYDDGRGLQLFVSQYNLKLGWFFDVQNKLKNSRLMSRRPLPEIYVLQKAIPSYKKTSPVMILNLVLALLGSFVFISFFLFIFYKIRSFRSQVNL
jgi:uncharacterized protein involved in exopolysaccharide biosynthesis